MKIIALFGIGCLIVITALGLCGRISFPAALVGQLLTATVTIGLMMQTGEP